MIDDKRNAKLYLESCALGYAAAVRVEGWLGAQTALHEAGIRLAAALGNLDAAERAELIALRRFREGVVALRGEMATGRDHEGGAILNPDPDAHAIETIDALLFFASPPTPAKETT